MIFLTLVLLATQSLALQYTVPSTFGGKTDFSDRGWRGLIGQLSPDIKLGKAPTTQLNIATEPTCSDRIGKCSTSYFGTDLALTQPATALLWVKWHQDATPFSCNSPDGCTVTSANSVADLTSQTKGWSVTASINAKASTNNDKPTVNGDAGASLSFQYSNSQINSRTITSTKTISSKCSQNNLCFLQTGTLMMSVSGTCDTKPVIICDRTYFPCEEFNSPSSNICSQWQTFTNKHCTVGVSTPGKQQCSMNVAVTDDNGEPISYQVFEQKPLSGKRSIEKREFIPAQDPYGSLPDGSSGAWLTWEP
ncbi:hypothetical protein EGM85_10930 [Macrococcus caseolyticus]|nr:hypothetical protein [Macrococcus caseolyticus]RKO12799.1 hypothetical protein D6861_10930 [Macrococcus caseolyticus]